MWTLRISRHTGNTICPAERARSAFPKSLFGHAGKYVWRCQNNGSGTSDTPNDSVKRPVRGRETVFLTMPRRQNGCRQHVFRNCRHLFHDSDLSKFSQAGTAYLYITPMPSARLTISDETPGRTPQPQTTGDAATPATPSGHATSKPQGTITFFYCSFISSCNTAIDYYS